MISCPHNQNVKEFFFQVKKCMNPWKWKILLNHFIKQILLKQIFIVLGTGDIETNVHNHFPQEAYNLMTLLKSDLHANSVDSIC